MDGQVETDRFGGAAREGGGGWVGWWYGEFTHT